MTRCGVQAEYDGSPKPDWVVKILQESDASLLGRLLLRLTSADEYHGDQASAHRAASLLNKVLLSCGVQIVFENGAPVLTEVDPNLAISEASCRTGIDSDLIVPDFEQLDLSDAEARELVSQWDEATKCYAANAFLAAMVMLGSLLESLLLLSLKRNRAAISDANISFTDANNRERPPERWSLSEMIEAATQLGWTNQKLRSFFPMPYGSTETSYMRS